ncbi:phosphatidylinositol-glycan biosynthesis class X protein [Rhincodon typus]|uniref:phosphatidylinositol-glycan biosynthesis class X protein n=1 Tax=Rhincodon typus TaxID=259920 RepID=UPI0009A2A5AA|nr:phosphatidylinositol-glycan biosynthesis class X protein [Rhincodon typus]XP_048460643.1 phosphatidylinositol-glycan biosynthesis class X protein [Rhincodon typus]
MDVCWAVLVVGYLCAAVVTCNDPLYSEPWLRSVSLNRHIVKNGFHRELIMDVDLGESAQQSCCVMIKQQLPPGLYVDPYELASLREQKSEEIFVQNEIDIEAPEYLSAAHAVIIYLKPDPRHNGHFTGAVPLHVRYHRPTDTKEATALVTLADPQLMIHCQENSPLLESWKLGITKAPCSANNHSICSWLNVNYHNVVETLTLQVPVGQKKDVLAVVTATLLTTILCCSLLIRAVWIHGEFEH